MTRPIRHYLAATAVGAIATTAVVVAGVSTTSASASTGPTTSAQIIKAVEAKSSSATKPTVVLVHGAFADSSGWNGVIERLRHDKYPTIAFANPLAGLKSDVDALKSFLRTIDGPVILVGHSYGGEVISGAADNDPDVKALVYVAAFVPDKGESAGELSDRPVAHPNPALPLKKVTGSDPSGADTLAYIDPAKFPATFAGDVKTTLAKNMAATQRPVALGGFNEPAEAAAWRTIPSWYLVAKQDKAINPDTERFMARRAKAHTVEVNASHAVMVSRPGAVTDLIESADRGTR